MCVKPPVVIRLCVTLLTITAVASAYGSFHKNTGWGAMLLQEIQLEATNRYTKSFGSIGICNLKQGFPNIFHSRNSCFQMKSPMLTSIYKASEYISFIKFVSVLIEISKAIVINTKLEIIDHSCSFISTSKFSSFLFFF